MRSKVFMSVVLGLVCQLGAQAVSAPTATFRCGKLTSSGNSLTLRLRNNGPDTVPEGTQLYYYYYTTPNSAIQTHSFTTTYDIVKGKVFDITAPAPAQTTVSSCGCSLRPIRTRPEVGPRPTQVNPRP